MTTMMRGSPGDPARSSPWFARRLKLTVLLGLVLTVAVLLAVPTVGAAVNADDDYFEVSEDQLLPATVLTGDSFTEIEWLGIYADSEVLSNPTHSAHFWMYPGHSGSSSFGRFEYRGQQDWNGTDSFVYRLSDMTGSDNGLVTINVLKVNDYPSFTKGPNVTVAEDSGAYAADWATAISPGPANEAGQVLTFSVVTNTNPGLFSAQPAVSPTGRLTFTPAPNATGSANLTVRLTDDALMGGGPLYVQQSFTITVSNASESTEVSLTCLPDDTLPYGSTYRLRGTLSSGGTGLAGRQLTLQRFDGVAWLNAAVTTTTADGTYEFKVHPTAKTLYQVVFAGFGDYQPSTSPACGVYPCCSVSAPNAPTSVGRGRSFTTWGTLKPRHTAGTSPVRIYKYRKVGRSWVSYGYVTARVTNYSSYSKYARSMSLPARGSWRLRAYAPGDSQHAATWSKTYDYLTVQ